jgi:predicted permease
VLVAGSMMLARSLGNLSNQDFGFELDGRVVVQLNKPPANYSGERLSALYRDLEERLKRLPGVRGAGLALYNPMTDNWGELVLVAGKPLPKPGEQAGASWDRVSANYLQDLGVKLVRGRHFSVSDNESSEHVAVVNEGFVKRFFKDGEDPLDRRFGLDLPEYSSTYRIVGIVRDAKFAGFQLDRPARPMFYVPLAQTVDYPDPLMRRIESASHFMRGIMLVTDLPPSTLEPELKRLLSAADPNLTITSVRTLQQQVDRAFDQERAVASLAGLFGVVALVLAAIGLYGMTAYSVAQRTNEIGIRMALGAGRGSVVGMVLQGAFRRIALGLVLGVPLAIGAGYLLSSQLYGVRFWDPLALAVGGIALAACAFVAAIIPANRAASISPIRALRTN